MDKSKKRDRSVNFTREETEILVSLVESKKNIIECRKSDAVTWQNKEKAWKAIEMEYNSCMNGVYRDAKHLKGKYEALKRDTRKKANTAQVPLTVIEEKIKEIIFMSGSDEGEAYDDSDQMNDPDLSNSHLEVTIDEPDSKKSCLEENSADSGTIKESSSVWCIKEESNASISSKDPESSQRNWNEWPQSLHPSRGKKRILDNLADEQMGIASLQKELIEQQIQENMLKKAMLQEEMEHKRHMYELEKQHMLYKLEILKTDLENAKNKRRVLTVCREMM